MLCEESDASRMPHKRRQSDQRQHEQAGIGQADSDRRVDRSGEEAGQKIEKRIQTRRSTDEGVRRTAPIVIPADRGGKRKRNDAEKER